MQGLGGVSSASNLLFRRMTLVHVRAINKTVHHISDVVHIFLSALGEVDTSRASIISCLPIGIAIQLG